MMAPVFIHLKYVLPLIKIQIQLIIKLAQYEGDNMLKNWPTLIATSFYSLTNGRTLVGFLALIG